MKYKLAICSLFRDNIVSENFDRYFSQIKDITIPQKDIFFSFLEGDSKDKTYSQLIEFQKDKKNVSIIKKDMNNPFFGSEENTERFRVLSEIANAVLEPARDKSDIILWVESDLIWDGKIIEKLLRNFEKPEVGIVAPEVFIENSELFYDWFAFRDLNTYKKWRHEYPPSPTYKSNSLVEVDSVGSCMMFRSEMLKKGVKFPPTNVILGFCGLAKTLGYRIFVDTSIRIYHPFKKRIGTRYI